MPYGNNNHYLAVHAAAAEERESFARLTAFTLCR
jgi:hypothetical protein